MAMAERDGERSERGKVVVGREVRGRGEKGGKREGERGRKRGEGQLAREKEMSEREMEHSRNAS